MESGHSDEILCIPGDKRNYGIELFQVVEICSSLQISKVPCLPDCYAGVCNYKGTITPVVRLWEENEADSGDRDMMVIVREQNFQMGIPIGRPPFIIKTAQSERIENVQTFLESEVWAVKDIYKKDGELYLTIDMEQTMENLIIYPV